MKKYTLRKDEVEALISEGVIRVERLGDSETGRVFYDGAWYHKVTTRPDYYVREDTSSNDLFDKRNHCT